MKKIILPGLLLGALVSLVTPQQTNAQIRNDRGTFTLPSKGDILVETGANLDFTGGTLFTLNDGFTNLMGTGEAFPALKLRFFGSDRMAHRVALHLGYNSTSPEEGDAVSDFHLAASYGMERIFAAAERLNTYVGADVSIGFGSHPSEVDPDETNSSFGFGVRAFTGMDYYVLPKVYLGMELGYGLGFTSQEETSTIGLAPYVTPSFRLGYILTSKKMRGKHEPSYRSRDRYDDGDDD